METGGPQQEPAEQDGVEVRHTEGKDTQWMLITQEKGIAEGKGT